MWLHLGLDGDDRVRRQDLYSAQQARFERGRRDEEAIEEYVRQLHRRSAYFARILDPEKEREPEVREYLTRLKTWRASVTYPALMTLIERHESEGLPTGELVRALSYVESFVVRRMICRIPTNSLDRIFQSLPAQLPRNMPLADGVRQVLSGERRFWPTDAELADAIRAKPFYQLTRGYQARVILRRLEETYRHEKPVDFARPELTIEHVMPQRPGREWLDVLAEECQDGECPEDLHDRLVHTLGNLTLTGMNAKLSHHPFERKQGLFDNSHLEMNRSIAKSARWGATEIHARAADLTERAIAVWPAPIPGVKHVERGRDWPLLHAALLALPDGRWTTYGALAAVVGSVPQAVGSHLANTPNVVNAHRVLLSNGRVSPQFRWSDGEDRGDVHEMLRSEGIRFSDDGVAALDQRLGPEELTALIGDVGS